MDTPALDKYRSPTRRPVPMAACGGGVSGAGSVWNPMMVNPKSANHNVQSAMLAALRPLTRFSPAVGSALVVAAGGAATILGAWFFQYVLHYLPCPLCFEQRKPYYVAIPLALVVALAAARSAPR